MTLSPKPQVYRLSDWAKGICQVNGAPVFVVTPAVRPGYLGQEAATACRALVRSHSGLGFRVYSPRTENLIIRCHGRKQLNSKPSQLLHMEAGITGLWLGIMAEC